MKKLRSFMRRTLHDQKGQGTAEYVLLLVIVVALVLMFKGKITNWMHSTTDNINTNISTITNSSGN